MFTRRIPTIISSIFVLVLCHTSALASPLDRPVTNEDLEPERVYSLCRPKLPR